MAKAKKRKKLNIALQGGGAHGAFTWGVLDYLLEDDRVEFEGIAATSAGALNGAALACGYGCGGEKKAREVLEDFWRAISEAGLIYSPVRRTPWEMGMALNPVMRDWSMEYSPAFAFFESFTHTLSPYQFNPMNINPVRDVLGKIIDFEKIHSCKAIKLFVTATNVRTGTAEVFKNEMITVDVLLASTALPFLFHAVEIQGEHYWDGGYMGNPSLWPLFYHAKCRDILIVHVNPLLRAEVPASAHQIENRLNEITFNASLLKELRAIAFVKKLINEDMLKDEYKDQYRDILLHAIRTDDIMSHLSVASKFSTDWSFLTHLRDLGRTQAAKWLDRNFDKIGKKASVNIEKDYLNV